MMERETYQDIWRDLCDDELLIVAQYLTATERSAGRLALRSFSCGLQKRFNFSDAILVEEEGTKWPLLKLHETSPHFGMGNFNVLREKFNFEGLKLLNVNAVDLILGGTKPRALLSSKGGIADLRSARITARITALLKVMDDIPSLRLVFLIDPDSRIKTKGGLRFASSDIKLDMFEIAVSLATKIDALPGWTDCDRWRVGIPLWPSPQNEGIPHRRVVVTTCFSDDRTGSSPQEWFQEVCGYGRHLPVGDLPLLRKITIAEVREEFIDWLKEINAPLLREVNVGDRTSEDRVEIQQADSWCPQTLKLGVDAGRLEHEKLVKLFEACKRKQASLLAISAPPYPFEFEVPGRFWFAKRDRWWTQLEELSFRGSLPSVVIESLSVFDHKVEFRCLREITLDGLDEKGVERWVEFLAMVHLPKLVSVKFGERCPHKTHNLSLELLRLPVFSKIRHLDVGDLTEALFSLDRPIGLPNLTSLTIGMTEIWEDFAATPLTAPLQEVFCSEYTLCKGSFRRCKRNDAFYEKMANLFPKAQLFESRSRANIKTI